LRPNSTVLGVRTLAGSPSGDGTLIGLIIGGTFVTAALNRAASTCQGPEGGCIGG